METLYGIIGLGIMGFLAIVIIQLLNEDKYVQLVIGIALLLIGGLIQSIFGENTFYLGSSLSGFFLILLAGKRILRF